MTAPVFSTGPEEKGIETSPLGCLSTDMGSALAINGKIWPVTLIRIEHLSEQEWFPMATLPIERALAYLDALEADRKAALALSEQKAEEAKLIQERQEGFRAALDILRGETSAGDAVSEKDREPSAGRLGDGERASGPEEPR